MFKTDCPTCRSVVDPSAIKGILINHSITLGGKIVSTKESITKVKDGVLKLKLEAQLADLEAELVTTNALRDT